MSEDENRRAFEKWISSSPYELEVSRFPDNEALAAWPGLYRHNTVQLAWEAWCERGNRHLLDRNFPGPESALQNKKLSTGPVALEAQPRDAGLVPSNFGK